MGCDANEVQLWCDPTTTTTVAVATSKQVDSLINENLDLVTPIWEAVPELQGLLQVTADGTRRGGAIDEAYASLSRSSFFNQRSATYSACSSAASALLQCALKITNAVVVDVQEARTAHEQKKAALEVQFSHIPFDTQQGGYAQFSTLCDDPKFSEKISELFISSTEIGSKFLDWWNSMSSWTDDVKYREVIYIINTCCEEGRTPEAVLPIFQARGSDIAEVENAGQAAIKRKIKVAQGQLQQLAADSVRVFAARKECTAAWSAFHDQLREKVNPAFQSLIQELEQRQTQISEIWLFKARAEVDAAKARLDVYLACKDSEKQMLTFKAKAISEPVLALLSVSKELAEAASAAR